MVSAYASVDILRYFRGLNYILLLDYKCEVF